MLSFHFYIKTSEGNKLLPYGREMTKVLAGAHTPSPTVRAKRVTSWIFSLCLWHQTACTVELIDNIQRYDNNEITVQVLSLFDQVSESKIKNSASWKGDWIFRRQRLAIIDQELLSIKPDLAIFQEVMAKKQSFYESDEAILQSGSLVNYQWEKSVVGVHQDTAEEESLAIAVGVPLKLNTTQQPLPLTEKSFIFAATLVSERQKSPVFNLKVAKEDSKNPQIIRLISQQMEAYLIQNQLCAKRVILAGTLPFDEDNILYQEFKNKWGLIDVAKEICQVERNCYTTSESNEIFLKTSEGEKPSRMDKILVHKYSTVTSSTRNFLLSKTPEFLYYKKFGLASLWPSQRFGWLASIKLMRCGKDNAL